MKHTERYREWDGDNEQNYEIRKRETYKKRNQEKDIHGDIV